ncbi:helix-turn-helix transcriptional regulator [Paracoccus nototheniae]|uniref:HGGxSTG domain-containing protein n=1 Tax=Paracoccus nototheniae TaxID=2489002 RepID=A0ABW4DWC5_9RHOB|nr:helix-turn-helix transcriptional regulator [Paracoccus nototheniae]
MTGAELAASRKAAGLSQTKLAQRAGIGRHAVSYWECKPQVERRAWAVNCMAGVLGLPDVPDRHPVANGWAAHMEAELTARDAAFIAMVARLQARSEAFKATRRVRCGARTRKGEPCRMKSEPGKRRCKFHGGKSTGAKTPEGKARIAEAQRRRWSKWRAEREQTSDPAVTPEIETGPDARA